MSPLATNALYVAHNIVQGEQTRTDACCTRFEMLAHDKIVGVVDSTFLEAWTVICAMQFELRRNFSRIVALSQCQRRAETASTRAHVRKLGRRLASSGTCRARLILNTCFLVLAGPVPMRREWSLCSIMPYRNVHVCFEPRPLWSRDHILASSL